MKVHLRQRKQTKTGKISLYLEIYKGSVTTPEVKTKVLRDYEYLNLYLLPHAATAAEKETNKETLSLANSIRAKRELEIKNGQYGFSSSKKLNASFIDYFQSCADNSKAAETNRSWLSSLSRLKAFAGDQVTFKEVTPAFCEKFKAYLIYEAKTVDDKHLSSVSIVTYFNKFKTCIKSAVKGGILQVDPTINIKAPRATNKEREYLTLDELKALAKTDCRYDVMKRAFLFSCLTGLRWGDIKNMKWSEVQNTADGSRIVFTQRKTKELQYIDLTEQARSYLGKAGQPDDKVFLGLAYSSYTGVALQQWLLKAGITKHITFHCGRHTFAVLLLTYDTDLYTVQKLLGHTQIATTQIYAKIIDKKKKEAVNKIPDLMQ